MLFIHNTKYLPLTDLLTDLRYLPNFFKREFFKYI